MALNFIMHSLLTSVTICNADMEQRNIFEVHEEKTFHFSTPLWVAAVANHLPVVKLLVRLGANMNAISDSGSTAVRSACFMTNVEVGKWVIAHHSYQLDFRRVFFVFATMCINICLNFS
jgi:hypothetical protein